MDKTRRMRARFSWRPATSRFRPPVLSAAVYERLSSRGQDDFADKVLSALRYQFGGHKERAASKKDGA